jgi:hypothetical protein
VDHSGALQGRANYNWTSPPQPIQETIEEPTPTEKTSETTSTTTTTESTETPAVEAAPQPATPPPAYKPSTTTKLQAQIVPTDGHSLIQLEHDIVGETCAFNVKAINPNPFDVNPSVR